MVLVIIIILTIFEHDITIQLNNEISFCSFCRNDTNNARNQVYFRIFNTLDFLSFNVNRKVIDDKTLLDYMKPFIIRYYEETFLTHASVDESDSQSYQEFKKLYLKLKKE